MTLWLREAETKTPASKGAEDARDIGWPQGGWEGSPGGSERTVEAL